MTTGLSSGKLTGATVGELAAQGASDCCSR